MTDHAHDFELWAEQLDTTFKKYCAVVLKAGFTPCSLQNILWAARCEGLEPALYLERRIVAKKP